MPDAKQTATQLIHYLVIGYALISLLYTAHYFYTNNNATAAPQHTTRSPMGDHSSSSSSLPPPPPKQYKEQVEAQAQELDHLPPSENNNNAPMVTWHASQSTMSEPYILSKIFSDAMQPTHLQPFYHKATAAIDATTKDITLTTLVTKDRFNVLSRLATNYKGPISAAIHITEDNDHDHDNTYKDTLDALHATIHANPDMQRYVDIHLIVDRFDRQFNLWRNVAKFFARTDYIMMLDVDFHLCTNLRSLRDHPDRLARLLDTPSSSSSEQQQPTTALVVPAFEYVAQADGLDYTTFPSTKQHLLQQVDQGKIDMFHKGWLKGHGSTDYARWYNTTTTTISDDDNDDEGMYRVTEYDFSYEPYIIYNKHGTPWCDERFIGYGANKAACLFEIYLAGINYVVLPNDFLIHQTHPYPEKTRRKERQYNRKLYSNFREEVCLRYARLFLANGQWDTTKADNLKKECAKNRGYRTAMKSIT